MANQLTSAPGHPNIERSPVSAHLGRVFQLLEIVLAASAPIRISDLADRVEIPKPTVHRLVANMIAEGLLRTDTISRRLAPVARTMGMMSLAQLASWPAGPLRAVIESLVAEVGESCNFGVLDRDAALYIERVECDRLIRVQLGAGSRVPLHASAIGKLLMAHLPAQARQPLLDTVPRPVLTAQTITDAGALEQKFKETRCQGNVLNRSENVDGLVGLAVPVHLSGDSAGRVIAGLSLHAPNSRLGIYDALALLPAIKAAASEVGNYMYLGAGDG